MSDEISPVRAALEAKYDEMTSGETSATTDVVETVAPAASESTTATDTTSRARAPDGRFAKSTTEAPPSAKPGKPSPEAIVDQGEVAGGPPPATSPAVPEAPKWKPPQSWKPNVREKWATLPPEVQEEADRLDKEYQKILREDAEFRKQTAQVKETFAPFEGLARSQGMDPVKYAGTVMQTAAALHMGTPAQKAQIVAQLIGSYGIDVEAVNAVMQGQAPAQALPTPQQQPVNVQAEVRRVFEEMQSHALTSQAQAAIDKAKGECEFWTDVGQGRIVTLAAGLINAEPDLAKTPEVALKTAYDMLSARTPEISGVLKQRAEAEAAKARLASTQQARTAGGSIRSQPAAVGEAKPANRREALERAASKLGI